MCFAQCDTLLPCFSHSSSTGGKIRAFTVWKSNMTVTFPACWTVFLTLSSILYRFRFTCRKRFNFICGQSINPLWELVNWLHSHVQIDILRCFFLVVPSLSSEELSSVELLDKISFFTFEILKNQIIRIFMTFMLYGYNYSPVNNARIYRAGQPIKLHQKRYPPPGHMLISLGTTGLLSLFVTDTTIHSSYRKYLLINKG